MDNNIYVDLNTVAKAKGLKSTRALRIAIQKGKYIAREITVAGGKSYKILYSSLVSEVQEKLEDEETRCTALIPYDEKKYGVTQRSNFITENAKLTALARVDVVTALLNFRGKYKTKKEADDTFLEIYNSGLLLPQVFKFIGTISIGTLHRWVKTYEDYGTFKALVPNYKYTQQNEYNSFLNNKMKQVFLKFLLHPNKFCTGKAISLTKHILEKTGYENNPCNLTFRRFAENYKKNNYGQISIC